MAEVTSQALTPGDSFQAEVPLGPVDLLRVTADGTMLGKRGGGGISRNTKSNPTRKVPVSDHSWPSCGPDLNHVYKASGEVLNHKRGRSQEAQSLLCGNREITRDPSAVLENPRKRVRSRRFLPSCLPPSPSLWSSSSCLEGKPCVRGSLYIPTLGYRLWSSD